MMLKKLIERCKCGVHLTVNEHRDYYDTVEDKLIELSCMVSPPVIMPEVREGIIRTGSIVDLQFFPDTPIGSYHIVHFDVDEALKLALDILENQ